MNKGHLLILATLLCSTPVFGETAASSAAKSKYIVVLHDPRFLFAQPNASAAASLGEPDFDKLGASVEERWERVRVALLPDAAINALRKHPAVKYLQRVYTGETTGSSAVAEPTPAQTLRTAVTAAPPTWTSGAYEYDGSGNVKSIGTATSPNGEGKTNSYRYDSAGRIVKATMNRSSDVTETFAYDSFGNMTQRSRGTTATPIAIDSNTNRLSGVEYDAAGNVLRLGVETYVVDAFNMMRTKVSSGGAYEDYVYTADDERIAVNDPSGVWHWTIRDFDGKPLREFKSGGSAGDSVWVWVEDYIYSDGQLSAAERPQAEGGRRYFHLDHLGTPRLITDSSGQRIALHDYYAFGLEASDFRQEMIDRGTDRPEPLKFTSHARDFTSGTSTLNDNQLDYMHARFYSRRNGPVFVC